MEDNITFENHNKERRYWFERALNLLMRREHSIVELQQKLSLKECPPELIDEIITECLEKTI